MPSLPEVSKSAHVEGSCWKISLHSERCHRHICLCQGSLFTWKLCYKMHRIKKETHWKRVMEMYVKSPSQEDSKVLWAHAHQAEFSAISFVFPSVKEASLSSSWSLFPFAPLVYSNQSACSELHLLYLPIRNKFFHANRTSQCSASTPLMYQIIVSSQYFG